MAVPVALRLTLDHLLYFTARTTLIFLLLLITIKLLHKLRSIKPVKDSRLHRFLPLLLRRFSTKLLITISIVISAMSSPLPYRLKQILNLGLTSIIGFILVQTTLQMSDKLWNELTTKKKHFNRSLLPILQITTRVIVWSLFILFILQNLGYNVTSLIAGLGIGGVAVAFALQNILADIFSSFSILLDNIIEVGDFIETDQYSGTVKKIGIKTTRLESLDGQEIIIPNKQLTESIVKNYSRMDKRRIKLQIGIIYETSNRKLKEALKIINSILNDTPTVDRVEYTIFKAFGDWAIILETVFYIKPPDYKTYIETIHKINLTIKERFEKAGIEMAYPTQVVKVEQ